ncbi:MAG: branched-chain amino acid transporter substrate-binding protein [Acidimicrobiaceae bacterium]|nr:branched-chain amino acid transporter substrate-binding protein [Acidimicrobiaceae bacterium]
MPGAPIKIGYSLSLSGGLAANGQTARLAHEIWQERVNARGGLLGRQVQLVCVDDRSDAAAVTGVYESLLSEEKVDLLLGGYGNNSISPAMPIAIEHGKYLVGLMGLGVNIEFAYDRFFAMIPTGTDPNSALTAGFFAVAAKQTPLPKTVAIVAADAPFSKNPILGARANAVANGLEVVSETKYPLTTTDFGPFLDEAQQSSPDILFYCAYLNDSIGLIRAIADSDLDPTLVGGAMIGPQASAVQTQLGPALNGIVNYEYWLPTAAMNFPGVGELIADYQQHARGTSADALGYYVAPFAYAQLQVLEQAIEATGGLEDDALAEFTRSSTFSTVVGDVTFGRLGEWSVPRVLTVQFRGIGSSDIAEFAKPEARVVVAPTSYASGELAVTYRTAAGLR